MKHQLFTGILCLCIVAALCCPASLAEDAEAFTDGFWAASPIKPDGLWLMQDLAYVDGTFYAYYMDSCVYGWRPNAAPIRFCRLPTTPDWKKLWEYARFEELSADDQSALQGVVTNLVCGEEEVLWGYNAYNGRVGQIAGDDILWNEQTMDTSYLLSPKGIQMRGMIRLSYIENGRMYMFVEMNSDVRNEADPFIIICFDLASGAYTLLETDHALLCSRYQAGFLLLLRRAPNTGLVLSVINVETGGIQDLSLPIPFQAQTTSGLPGIGGLAYDAQTDTILCADRGKVWASKAQSDFEAAAMLSASVYGGDRAWSMADGRYAIMAEGVLFLKGIR